MMDNKLLLPVNFFNLNASDYQDLFNECDFVWDALKILTRYIQSRLKPQILGTVSPLAAIEGDVFIGRGTIVEAGTVIKGPVIIGSNCEIRAGAYIRENSLVSDEVIIGHATEIKHCILFKRVTLPHFAFVGDSILGYRVHLGAGVRLSNFKINRQPVTVSIDNNLIETGLLKFGAVLGDDVEIGCNA